MKKERKKRTEIGCGADDLRVGTGRDADGTENGDINKDRELDMRIGMYAALDVLEPEDVEAFLSRIPEETWSEDRLENMVSDLEDNHACDGEEDRISVQKIRDRVQQQVSENLKENAENQAGEGITRQNFETVNRKKVKSNHFSWRRLAGAAAVAALALLVWQKDTVYAGLRRMLRLVPGVAVYEENEAAWYTVVPVNARFSWQGWIYELQEGYVERMPDQAGLTNRGRLVIRLTAQKDSVSAAESEQQASTGDPANMRENTQENTQLSLIHISSDQAKEYLLKTVEDEVKSDTAKMVKELESRAKEEAGKKAKEYVVTAIQRCAADHVAETTISVVQLPNDEMKGRIIGREGRNIRTLETMTGVDLIIDDTPEAVILSGFDPIRREVARIALEKLIVDGRIHPARIEEMVEKAQKEVETMIREEGEAAVLEVGVHGIHPELVRLLGRMKFRTSYGQNALKHSIEVAHLSGLLAGEIGLDVRVAKRAGLLHDIGKSIDHDVEGSHIQIGADLCRKYKESRIVINAVEAHHGDVEPESLIACVVQAADTISAARPGARRETLETYTNRLKQLEDITNTFKGVDKSFAIQAGREIRVMVVPEQVSDADMVLLARDISKQIEAELEYPGQIKVNVIRESRVTDYAK